MLFNLLKLLHKDGFIYIPQGKLLLKPILQGLGEVTHTAEVIPDRYSPALLRSTKALSPHTDHPKIRYIVLLCEQPAEKGGTSLLIDGWNILEQMTPQERKRLQSLYLKTHKVFPDDAPCFPILSYEQGTIHLYYTHWLASEKIKNNEVFQKLTTFIFESTPIQIKLKKNDLLY